MYTSAVWLVDQFNKRNIANSHAMDVYNFNWEGIYRIPEIVLPMVPTGLQIYAQ